MDEPRSGRSEPVDEISLRDLYLIIRRNIGWLLGVPLVVAIAVFGFTQTLPSIYEAQSTTVVTPPPIEIESERGITFKPSVNVTFEAYERLVMSMPVATSTLERLQADGDIDGDLIAELTAKQLVGMFELENLTGPSRTGEGTPLTVTHSVRHNDPVLSATIANAWAAESLRTIQTSLLDTLSPVDATTEREIASLLAELEAAESALETFDAGSDLALQRLRIERLSNLLTNNELELDSVRRRLDVSEARRQTLDAQLADELNKVTTSDPVSDAFLAGLSLDEAREFLTAQRELAAQERTGAQTELDAFDEEHNLAVLAARIENYQSVVATGEIDLAKLRDRATVLTERRELLEQQLATAIMEAGTTDSLSNRYMTGLTIGQAGDFIANQLGQAEAKQRTARQALDAFDEEHNLAVLAARIENYQSVVATGEIDLARLRDRATVLTERRELLEQQLATAIMEAGTTDSLSNRYMTGLTIGQAGDFIANQLGQAETKQRTARQALDAFDREHNLARQQARIDQLNAKLTSREGRLEEIPGELEVVSERIGELGSQLADQPLSLKLQDLLIASPLLSETARTNGQLLDALAGTELQREQVNPTHVALLGELLSAGVRQRALEAERSVLVREIEEADQELAELRDTLIDVRTERSELALAFDQADAIYRSARSRSQELDYAQLDPRGTDRTLRGSYDGTHLPPELALQDRLRDVDAELTAVTSQVVVLQARLAEAERLLPELRNQRIRFAAERNDLSLAFDQADAIYRSARSRSQELDYAQLDPRGTDRTLRASYDTTNLPPELQLQDRLRDVDGELTGVRSEIAVLQARLNEANVLLPQLRNQRIALTTEREQLADVANRAVGASREIEAKLGNLRRGAIDTRTERSLRDTTPEVLQLQSALRQEAVAVRAAQTELATLQSQIEADGPRLAAMRQELTGLETQRNRLERSRSNARQAYDDVAQLGPTIAYVTQLAPTTARILSRASVPVEPVGPRALLMTALATVVTGMLTLLFIFLREAVSEPRIPTIRARVATEEEAEGGDLAPSHGRLHGAHGVAPKEVGHLGHT